MFQIYTIEVTPFAQNARVLFDSQSRAAVVVDPGGDLPRIFSVVEKLQPTTLDVLLTHAHLDHAGGTAGCLTEGLRYVSTPPRLFAHTEALLRGMVQQQAKLYALPVNDYQNVPEPDVLLDDKQTFSVGSYSGQVLYTPGHAPDHIALFFSPVATELYDEFAQSPLQTRDPILIAGDTLFAGSIGRTDLPGGSYQTLIRSIQEQLFTLPDDTLVLCGHGPNTKVGHERQFNPFFQS